MYTILTTETDHLFLMFQFVNSYFDSYCIYPKYLTIISQMLRSR